MMTQSTRICLAASSGGHLSELTVLSQSWQAYDAYWVITTDVVRKQLSGRGSVYVVGECNRETPLKTMGVFLRCIRIVLHERPSVVISTGAAVGAITCWLAKLRGAKIVWIDSITNTAKLSLSGRLVRPIADLCLAQWADVAKLYNNVDFVGNVI